MSQTLTPAVVAPPLPPPPLRLHSAGARAVRTPVTRHPRAAHARPVADLEIAIPAFNEAARLPRTLELTVQYLLDQPWTSRIVVVDNGSCDGTADAVRAQARLEDGRIPIALVGCARPGKGAAVRRGLLSSRSRFVGFFDADLATPVETLATAMKHLEGGAAAVIASRHTPGSEFVRAQPAGRRLGGAAFRLMARSVVRGVHDTQCGFKFFERHAVTHAMVTCRDDGFAFDVELLHRLQQTGREIVEVPVAWSHDSESSFSPWRDGIASFGAVWHVRRAALGRAS